MKQKVRLLTGLPAEHIRAKLHYHNREADIHRRALAFYLCEVADRTLYREFGAPSAVVFAENELQIPRREARELIRVGRKLRELRKIGRAFDKGKITWSKVREIVRVAVKKTEKDWLRFAIENPIGRVEEEVARSRKGDRPGRKGRPPRPVSMTLTQRLPADTYQIVNAAYATVMHAMGKGTEPAEAWKALGEHVLKTYPAGEEVKGRSPCSVVFHVNQDCTEAWVWGAKGRMPIPLEAALRVAAVGDVITARDIEDPGNVYAIRFGEAGTVSPEDRDPEVSEAMRAVVLARDDYRCQICGHDENLNVHHLEARANGGRTRVTGLRSLRSLRPVWRLRRPHPGIPPPVPP